MKIDKDLGFSIYLKLLSTLRLLQLFLKSLLLWKKKIFEQYCTFRETSFKILQTYFYLLLFSGIFTGFSINQTTNEVLFFSLSEDCAFFIVLSYFSYSLTYFINLN